MSIKESGEMYLETILILSDKLPKVRSIDIAEYRSLSKPSVCRAVAVLKRNGYIDVDKTGYITLTNSGKNIAEKIYERHTVITAILMRLGVSEEDAVKDACKMEHVISDSTFDAIKAHLRKYTVDQ